MRLNPIKKYLLNSVLRAPDEGAGGSEAGADAGGGGKGNLAAAAAAAAASKEGADPARTALADGSAGAPEWAPKGLPAHMLGKDAGETLGKVFTAFDGFRQQQGELGTIPKAPAEYKFEPTEKLKPFIDGFADDELYNGILADFHAAGIRDKQFAAVMPKILERILGTGSIAAPVNYDDLVMTMVPDTAKAFDEQGQRQAAGKRISDALAWVDGAKAQKAMPEDVADYLVAQLGDDPKGIRAIEYIQSLGKKAGPALGGQGGGGALSAADYDAHLAKEPAEGTAEHKTWQTERTRLAKQIWPD